MNKTKNPSSEEVRTSENYTVTDNRTKTVVDEGHENKSHLESLYDPQRDAAFTRIKVQGGFTKNLGEYQSLRCDVGIDLPCNTDQISIQKAFEFAADWVTYKVETIVNSHTNKY